MTKRIEVKQAEQMVSDRKPGNPGESPARELRAATRYPVDMAVQITVVPRKGEDWKTEPGRALDMSSQGILFTCEHPMEESRMLKLTLCWPVPLEGGTGLQLFMRAKVVRNDGQRVGAQIIGYEFRTRPSNFMNGEGANDRAGNGNGGDAHLWQYLRRS